MAVPTSLFFRVSQTFHEHPKLQETEPIAQFLFVHIIGYCSRNLTDGYIPKHAAQTLIGWHDHMDERLSPHIGRRPMTRLRHLLFNSVSLLEQLLEAELLQVVPGGYQVHDYLDWQQSRAEVAAAKEKTAARQRKCRAKKKAVTPVSRVTSRVSHAPVTPLKIQKKKEGGTPTQGIQKNEEEEETTTARRSDSGAPSHPVRFASSSVSLETTERQNEPEIATRRVRKTWVSGPIVTLEDLMDWQRLRRWGIAGPQQVLVAKGLLVEKPITSPERVEAEQQTEKKSVPTLGLAISVINRLRTEAESNLERRRRGLAPAGVENRVNLPSATEEMRRAERLKPLTEAEHAASMSSMQECLSSLGEKWAAGQ